jgi:hypothetical protein
MDAFEERRIKDAEASKKAMERLSKLIIMDGNDEPPCRRKQRPPQHQSKPNPWFDGI